MRLCNQFVVNFEDGGKGEMVDDVDGKVVLFLPSMLARLTPPAVLIPENPGSGAAA